ncbi:MAG: winged helix-turn-helix transcriptional regulator, partial [Rhodospirillales bacterium]
MSQDYDCFNILSERTCQMKLDNIDKNIIRALQGDGRLSNQELSERVGLSPSPCLRRLRALESAGVIEG